MHRPAQLRSVPQALAAVHRTLAVGDTAGFRFAGAGAAARERLVDVVVGGGFTVDDVVVGAGGTTVRATRVRTLADVVAPRLRVLVCGLNPSLYAADCGIGFARPGNRFWPAALGAGLVTRDRDPDHAVRVDRVGMTDLVKRATTGARELARDEYATGFARVERLCAWLQPGAVLFVGLDGWRAAVDRSAPSGWQPRAVGGAPAYVMPSTSGLNARTSLTELTAHMRAALSPPRRPARGPITR